MLLSLLFFSLSNIVHSHTTYEDTSLIGVIEKKDIGVLKLSNKQPPTLQVYFPPLPIDECYMCPSQWKQGFHLLPIIGAMTPGGDSNYVAQDSLLQDVHMEAAAAGYTMKKVPENATEEAKLFHINKGNMITAKYLNFVRTLIGKLTRDHLTNDRSYISKSKKFNNQSSGLHDHVRSIQCNIIQWIHENVPTLSQQLFPDGVPESIETDLNKICNKVINIENQIKKGVRTGWKGCEEGGIWVGQWFIYTMFSDRHRRTVSQYPNGKSLRKSLPGVVGQNENPPLKDFVCHVADSNYKGPILHPTRHNSLHWLGKPIASDLEVDVEDPFS